MQSLMIDRARLGSVWGVATVYVRRNAEVAEHRGSFWFRAEHDEEIRRLLKAGTPVELVGLVAGERRHLTTRLVSADPGTGLAIFEGSGEPTLAVEQRSDAAG